MADSILRSKSKEFAKCIVFLCRKLKQNGVEVYFETAGLWIQKMDSELQLSIMFAIAQEESVDKSRAVKWGIDAGFKSGDGL